MWSSSAGVEKASMNVARAVQEQYAMNSAAGASTKVTKGLAALLLPIVVEHGGVRVSRKLQTTVLLGLVLMKVPLFTGPASSVLVFFVSGAAPKF